MWYIIAAEPGAKIYAGLNTPMSVDGYVECISAGTFAENLAIHDSAAGDVFFLPAGRVHAIGAGNLLAEIQESSDITYRIYDYDRLDASGQPRELHTELACAAIDFKVHHDYKTPRPPDHAKDIEIIRCEHFTTKRMIIDKEEDLSLSRDSFTVVMCINGQIELICKDGSAQLGQGHTALLPALIDNVKLAGKALLLVTRT